MDVWTRKSSLNFGSQTNPDSRSVADSPWRRSALSEYSRMYLYLLPVGIFLDSMLKNLLTLHALTDGRLQQAAAGLQPDQRILGNSKIRLYGHRAPFVYDFRVCMTVWKQTCIRVLLQVGK